MSFNPGRPSVRRLLGPGRRFARRAIIGNQLPPDQARLQETWDWVNGMQTTVNNLVNQHGQMQNDLDRQGTESGQHVDLVLDQLWRRLESADARLASEVQHLAGDFGRRIADLEQTNARLAKENAAILRLIGHEELIEQKSDVADKLPIVHQTLFSEVERGNPDVLTAQLREYTKFFTEAPGAVVDLGSGRGDFLELLKESDVKAYGVDLDDDCVAAGNAAGLDIRQENIFTHLESLKPESIGGAFSSQVVEHLPAETLLPLFEELYRVLKPGSYVVIETPNPATFATHVQSFWRDPTHIRPVPAPTLDFNARSAGFITESTIFSAPAEEGLEAIESEPPDPFMAEFVHRFNRNFDKLGGLLYGFQNYAIVVRKP